jgi:hypothetical protein
MEIDPEELKKFFRMWIGALRKMEAELLAHAGALTLFVEKDPKFVSDLLEVARKNPKIESVLGQKYDTYLNVMIESVEKGVLDQGLVQFLRDWKSKGPVN